MDIDLCVTAEVCPPAETALEAAQPNFASGSLITIFEAIWGNERASLSRRNYEFQEKKAKNRVNSLFRNILKISPLRSMFWRIDIP